MAVQSLDWDVLRLQYELLHEPVESLAVENQVSPVIINRAVKSGGWKRMAFQDISRTFTDILDVDLVDDKVVEQVEQRVRILHALKRAALNPRVITLEAAIVSKAIEIAQAIQPEDALASKRLTDLIKIVTEMRSVGTSPDGEDGKPTISVNIMNKA